MKRWIIACALLGAVAGPALADDRSTFVESCRSRMAQVESRTRPNMPPAQQAVMDRLMSGMCPCLGDKLAAGGKDGAMVLRLSNTIRPDEVATPANPEGKMADAVARVLGMDHAAAETYVKQTFMPVMQAATRTCSAELMHQ